MFIHPIAMISGVHKVLEGKGCLLMLLACCRPCSQSDSSPCQNVSLPDRLWNAVQAAPMHNVTGCCKADPVPHRDIDWLPGLQVAPDSTANNSAIM